MRIGIIGAMAQEIELLKETIENQTKYEYHGVTFIAGQIGNKEVVLVQSGIGKVNATISTVLLIQQFNVDYIINTGTAGAVDSGLEIGDIIIAHSLLHHDVDVTGFDYKLGQMAGMPELYYPDTHLLRTTQEIIRSLDIEPVVGLVVSGDEFVNSPVRVEEIQEKFPAARAVEMESAAIAQTAYVMGVPFVIIRAISDTADHTATTTFDEFVEVAGRISAEMVIQLVQAI